MSKYSSYILCLLISILVVILYVNSFGPLQSLQQSITDLLVDLTAPDGIRADIVLVTIDEKAQDEFGPWPWNRDLIADLLAAIAGAEPGAMLVDLELGEDAFQDSAGYTGILAGQLSWMENVILPYDIALATYRSSKTNNPDHLYDYSMAVDNPLGMMDEESSLQVRKVFLPAEKLLQNDPCLGFDYTMPDDDRVLRHQPLAMNYEGFYYPSISLIAAATYLKVSPVDVTIIEGQHVRLGDSRRIPTGDRSEFFVTHFPAEAFKSYSAALVIGENFELKRLSNKMVLVGLTDPDLTEAFRTPIGDRTPELIIKASAIENIINENMIAVRNDRVALDMIILFLLGAVFAFILPQVSQLYRIVICVCGLIILANVNYFLISSFSVAPQTVYFGLELILFMVASYLLDSALLRCEVVATTDKTRTKLPKVDVGKRPQASVEPVPVREIRASTHDQENQPTAMIDASQHQPFDHQALNLGRETDETAAAPGVPETPIKETAALKPGTTDSPPPTVTPEEEIAPETPAAPEDAPAPPPQTAAADATGGLGQTSEIKSLGRYKVSSILGKGAMGMVYRGVDPAINRPVALKTIRLDFVNDPEELAELKERLYREAQAAGKLSHPNIVTIYDVGSEGHLQYIAMECLEGQTLEEMIKKKVKFNYRIIAQVIMQICSALEYAHEQGIVHRDIKPANIMILKDYRAKVMDYGIARVDSSSMTKTGIAMGTPNYISPEQLKGQKSDHRADLFSLGVVMYELLLGKRPFKGENITSLMYSVLNHEPEKPSNINPQIPLLFDRIIDRALKKDKAERYQKASEIMTDLSDFVEAFSTRD